MVDLCAKQVADLRKELQNRYGLNIDTRITRVEFENSNKVRTYFRAEDSWVPPQQPKAEEPKHEYILLTWAKKSDLAKEPKKVTIETLHSAMNIYATYQIAGYTKVELWEDGKILQRCTGG